jgi:hypothetical protein
MHSENGARVLAKERALYSEEGVPICDEGLGLGVQGLDVCDPWSAEAQMTPRTR